MNTSQVHYFIPANPGLFYESNIKLPITFVSTDEAPLLCFRFACNILVIRVKILQYREGDHALFETPSTDSWASFAEVTMVRRILIGDF